ncbi:kinase-like protein [Lophiostoma macrostomum CBS 122681]|uniref:non-specific serine/threonine protein kinase n=1 Tax=Lophiostoma macrostomum CBS 122681 TaxID=1314788 RepID=A0A6A6TWK4_9PLEO|nr:kinase-like protein [Lophiostoma macrostomum CBS 122681]
MPPVSDLVRDSKLKTYITGDVTRHVIESSGRHPRQRRVRKEQTWRRAGRLGEGAFGTVWKEVLEAGESDIKARAVKVVRKRENRSKLVNYSKELEAIAKFSHPKYNSYFVESYGWFETEDAVFITMELFDHGDLQNYLWRKAEKTLPEDEVKQIALQVLEGLEHMHDNGFAHRDLKPSNILVRDPGPEWWVKIGDFGISKRAEEGMTALRTVSGTRDFMAPEIRVQDGSLFAENLADNKVYTDKVDIWSLGEIIYRALCGEGPFSKTLAAYCSHNVAFPLEALRKREISEEGCSLIQALMNVYPEERLSAKQALQHEWFANLQESSPRSSGEFPR